jgi:hypothetical protein
VRRSGPSPEVSLALAALGAVFLGCPPPSKAPGPPPQPSAKASASASAAPAPAKWLVTPAAGDVWARESVHPIAWTDAPEGASIRVDVGDAPGEPVAASVKRLNVAAPASGDSVEVKIVPSWREPVTVVVKLAPSARRRYQWKRVTEKVAFPARDGAGALVHRGKMWLIGGWNPMPWYPRLSGNDVWSSTDGAHWQRERPNTFINGNFDAAKDWEGRHTGGYVVFRDKMWIVGGDPIQGHYQGDVWSTEDGRKWSRVTARAPWGDRALHYTLVFRDRIWVMGGQTMPDFVDADDTGVRFALFDDVWSSPDGERWEKVPAVGPRWAPRGALGGSAVHDGKMWVIGGGTYESVNAGHPGRTYYADAWSSPDGARWTLESQHVPWAAREYHSLATWDGRLWIVAGYNDSGNIGDAWYSADGRDWYPSTDEPSPDGAWDPRHAASLWVYKDGLYLAGGGDEDVWKLSRR